MSKQSIEFTGQPEKYRSEYQLNQFVVITGVSGSGKSPLAFDTLYAEGQRRFVLVRASFGKIE